MKVFEGLPSASPRLGFFQAAASWLDAALVEFGPEGTMHYVQGNIPGKTERLYTTGMRERQIIFGDTAPLEQAILDIDRSAKPDLLFVTSSPVSEIIGIDLEAEVRDVRARIHAALSVWDHVPVEGTRAQGRAAAYEKAAGYLRQTMAGAAREEKTGCLILGLGEADWNGAADLNELRRMLEAYFGIPCLNEPDGRYRLSDIPKARCLLVVQPEAAALAQTAEELWGLPWHRCVPYGLRACEQLVSALEQMLRQKAAPCWAAERQEIKRSLAQFREKAGRRRWNVCLEAGNSRAPAWTGFLEELGLAVSRPADDWPLLSTGEGTGGDAEALTADLLLGCGFLCARHPEIPSLCVDYPAAGQKLFSRHIPMMGSWGAENVMTLLFSLLRGV